MRAKFTFATLLGGLLLIAAARSQEHFTGVGLVLAFNKDALTVVLVLPDTPASRAGLSKGLLIQKIDDAETGGMPLKACVEKLRGAAGTKVKLELVDPQHSKTNTVELIRADITVQPKPVQPTPR
jgi:carboxyl-terminal processing protease